MTHDQVLDVRTVSHAVEAGAAVDTRCRDIMPVLMIELI
jgi:hypothetical protein